ncbi:hypothetical protein N2152v2_008120 [Parachlorella kessleri]
MEGQTGRGSQGSWTKGVLTSIEAHPQTAGDLRESDEFLEDLEELEEDVGQEVSTNNLDWGEKALEVARQLLAEQEAFSELELFSLRAIANGKRLDIRLDKMTDLYGSPSLEDIEAFAQAFTSRMEACLGEEAAGEIEVEVSSPGAERVVRVPGELERFAELPMKVEFHSSEDPEKIDTRVFDLVEVDSAAGMSRWRLANVRANRQQGGKGRGMNKKQREQMFEVPVASLRRVNLHLDL